MEARKCDRCGQFYINNYAVVDCTNVSNIYLTKFDIISHGRTHIDLCCDCKHDLDEWFGKFKKEEQNDECEEV